MDSQQQLQEQFLQAIADDCVLTGDTRSAFLKRFNSTKVTINNQPLAGLIAWNEQPANSAQKLQDELDTICSKFVEKYQCVITKPKRGRQPKGNSPWEQGYKWLWNVKFPEWQNQQVTTDNNRQDAHSTIKQKWVLILKGHLEDAKPKLAQITDFLRQHTQDPNLDILNTEAGSIILIIESTPNAYQTLKLQIQQGQITNIIDEFPVEKTLEWLHYICQKQLQNVQQRLSTHSLLNHAGVDHKVEDIYVPLGLVERKQQSERKPIDDPLMGSQLYQEEREAVTKKYQYDQFLSEVLQGGNSPKSQGKRVMIIGEPGAGKTTLLQNISKWITNNFPEDLVIWISLANVTKSLEDYLLQNWLKQAVKFVNQSQLSQEVEDDFLAQFNQHKVWLLLDGLDEMSLSQPLAEINQSFAGVLSHARIIMTCRVNLWETAVNPLSDFDVFRTLNFSYPQQVELFIQQWFKDEKTAKLLCDELKDSKHQRLQDLVKNPLRLTLLCSTWTRKKGQLPDTQAKLYELYVNKVYEWTLAAKGKLNKPILAEFNQNPQKQELLNQKLGELAKTAIDRESYRFALRSDLVKRFLVTKEEGEYFLNLALELGWLNQIGIDEDENPVYAFYHPTFQEYFAACAIPDWDFFLPRNHVDSPVEGKRYRIFEKQWQQVYLLWMGRGDIDKNEKEKFIRALVSFDDSCGTWDFGNSRGFYEYQAYLKTGIGISEFKLCSLADQIVAQIVKWGFGYFNIEKQEWRTFLAPMAEGSRGILPESDRQRVITELIRILQSTTDEFTRRSVAESLGKIAVGNETAISELIRVFQSTTDAYTCWSVAESLGKIAVGNETAISELIRVFQSTTDESTRRSVSESLGKIAVGNETAISELIRVLQSTTDESTRRSVSESLGKIDVRNETAISELIRILQSTTDESTRRSVSESLGKIDVRNETAISELIRILQSTTDVFTSWRVAESLGKILKTKNNYLMTVSALNKPLTNETYENNFDLYEKCFKLLWKCAENLTYPEFYQAWHNLLPKTPHPETEDNTPSGNTPTTQTLETTLKDPATILQNLRHHLQPTDTTFPLCLDISSLQGEPQNDYPFYLLRQITRDYHPEYTYPTEPTKKHLLLLLDTLTQTTGKRQFALIFGNLPEPLPTEINQYFRQLLLPPIAGISFLTNTPIEPPLRGFPPQQENLLSIIQTWLGELG